MEEQERERLKELIKKAEDAGGDLRVLTQEETREMMRLIRKWIGQDEFGFPISGEEG